MALAIPTLSQRIVGGAIALTNDPLLSFTFDVDMDMKMIHSPYGRT